MRLSSDILVSKFAFKWVNLYRYAEVLELDESCVKAYYRRAMVGLGCTN